MRALQLYFRLHRPYELNQLDDLEGGYFGGEAAFREANRTEYQPFFALLERNSQKFPNLRVSLSVSGAWLEQAERLDPELIRRLKKLVQAGNVELLMMPYDYSLASFYDEAEFTAQMDRYCKKVEDLFGAERVVLVMPELIYHDNLALWAEKAGFAGILAGAAERVLDYRSANQVFDVAGCKNLRVIFQNTRFSKALRQATDLVMVEGVKASQSFVESDETEEVTEASHKKMTATDFVRGMTGARQTKAQEKSNARNIVRSSGQMVFSAKKLQKELELECLRGASVNLCLDVAMFRDFRAEGVVRFFDEFLANWLKTPGNRFVNASEMLKVMQPKVEVSIKSTIDWRMEEESSEAGLSLLKDVRFCPPSWLRQPEQVKLSRKLYLLRENVLKAKSEELYHDFERLTDLSYFAQMNAERPFLVGDARLRKRDKQLAELETDHFAAILDYFIKKVNAKQPELLKVTAGKRAEASESETRAIVKKSEKTDDPDDFSVKVQRLAGSKKPDKDGVFNSDWNDLVWDEKSWQAATNAMDDVMAEVQFLTNRISQKKAEIKEGVDDLTEAEVVTKKKKGGLLKKLVVE